MSKLITFSTKYPSDHLRVGDKTFFVERIWASLVDDGLEPPELWNGWYDLSTAYDFDGTQFADISAKYHTIRGGNRFKVGDKFSPRIWSDKPYNSKQVIIAPDIEVKKIFDIEIKRPFKSPLFQVFIDDVFFAHYNSESTVSINQEGLELLAKNDGLTLADFDSWFKTDFKGQIICWSENIEYKTGLKALNN